MIYKPIKTKKIYEEIADTLIAMIKTGELKPGERLDSIEQLAKSFEVSRSVIREALSGMRAMGLVDIRQGEGTYVKKFDAANFHLPVTTAFLMKQDDVKELFEVRKILEVGAVKAAAMNHDEKDLIAMKEALHQMKKATGDGNIGDKSDFHFHLAIANATHNQMLANLLNSVSEIMMETIRETRKLLYVEGREAQLLAEHQSIFDAIKAKDSEKAQRYMLNHLIGVESVLSEYI